MTNGPAGAGAAGIEVAPPHERTAPEATVLTVVIELVALHPLNVEKHVVLHPWLECAVLPPVAVMTPEQMALQSLAVCIAVHDDEDDCEFDCVKEGLDWLALVD